MRQLTGLTGAYIQIKQKDGSLTCGGDQNFFKGAPAGSADERKQRLGCGVTALLDVFLYLAEKNGGREELSRCTGHGLSETRYREYYNRIYRFVGGIPPWAKNGLSFVRIQVSFNRMTRRQGWRLHAKWGFRYGRLLPRIQEMLSRDIPVIWCIPYMVFRRDKGQKVTFYESRGGHFEKSCRVSAHYVVILGIVEDRGQTFLRISSWGKEYYVNWEEYCALLHPPLGKHPVSGLCRRLLETVLGNVLYIY